MTLPLGISRARDDEDIDSLREVFGSFGFMDFNVSRTSKTTYSIRIKRSQVGEARGGTMELDETVGGMVDDLLRLTYSEHVEFLGTNGSSTVKVRFTSNK
jgi:hypothetical protein